MAMGMSYDDFWNGDAEMAKAYREAHRLRKEMEDEHMWRQGLYVYHALCCVIPALHPMKPSKPLPYPDKPYSAADAEDEALLKEDKELRKGMTYMEVFAANFNHNFGEGRVNHHAG